MKKILIVLAIVLAISSCSDFFNYTYEPPANVEMPVIDDPYDTFKWVFKNMVPALDNQYIDYWQAPHESVLLKTGDCEDPVILSMYYFDKFDGYKTYMVLAIIKKSGTGHALLEINSDKGTEWYTFVDYRGTLYALPIDVNDPKYEIVERMTWDNIQIRFRYR